MSIFHDPTIITDITQISTAMGPLKSLSIVIAYALIGFLVPLEVVYQNVRSMEGRHHHANVFVNLGVVLVGLVLYDQIFNFLVKIATVTELAILPEDQWSSLWEQLAQFSETRKVSLMISSIALVFTWLASFLALLLETVLYWIRYCLLSVLYFVGPITFVFQIFEPTTFLPKSWFRNVLQISLWTVVLKIIVRVMLQLKMMSYITQANTYLDVLTIIGINLTFVVIVILSPFFTACLISGQTIGPFVVMATTFLSNKSKPVVIGAGKTILSGAGGLQRAIMRPIAKNQKDPPVNNSAEPKK